VRRPSLRERRVPGDCGPTRHVREAGRRPRPRRVTAGLRDERREHVPRQFRVSASASTAGTASTRARRPSASLRSRGPAEGRSAASNTAASPAVSSSSTGSTSACDVPVESPGAARSGRVRPPRAGRPARGRRPSQRLLHVPRQLPEHAHLREAVLPSSGRRIRRSRAERYSVGGSNDRSSAPAGVSLLVGASPVRRCLLARRFLPFAG